MVDDMYTRTEALKLLKEVTEELKRLGMVARIKNDKHVKLKIDALRGCVYALSNYLKGLKDVELDEIKKRIEELEAKPGKD